MMKILFYAKGEDSTAWLSALRQRLPTADCRLWEGSPDSTWQADYALVWRPPADLFVGQSQLKGIINLGAGVDQILALSTRPATVPVLKLRDAGMAAWMTDYVRYGLLHFSRAFDRYRRQQEAKTWRPWSIAPRQDWPVGVLGLGAIGCSVAQHLAADGYPVRGWSRSIKNLEGIVSYAGNEQLDEFLKGCRALVNLLPKTPATLGLIGQPELARLLPDAIVISGGRGEVFDELALADALEHGRLRGALLDVFAEEPLPPHSPLWGHPGVIVTPHIAAPTPVQQAVVQVVSYIEALETNQPVEVVKAGLGY